MPPPKWDSPSAKFIPGCTACIPEHGRDAEAPEVASLLLQLSDAGRQIQEAGMRFNAGHALNYYNVQPVSKRCKAYANCTLATRLFLSVGSHRNGDAVREMVIDQRDGPMSTPLITQVSCTASRMGISPMGKAEDLAPPHQRAQCRPSLRRWKT